MSMSHPTCSLYGGCRSTARSRHRSPWYQSSSFPKGVFKSQAALRQRKHSFHAQSPSKQESLDSSAPPDPEAVTKQYGLEAGIASSFKNGDKLSAKDLLKRYGVAYLATSITLAILSFSVCYMAIDVGVDMPALLSRIGLSIGADTAAEQGSKVALAYAVHKALSPVRFPPTVALTPLVAQWLGKRNPDKDSTNSSTEDASRQAESQTGDKS